MITHNGSDVRIMNYGNNSQEWACDRSKPHEKSHLHKKKVSNSTLSLADDESQM